MTGMGCLTSSPGLVLSKTKAVRDLLRRLANHCDRRWDRRGRESVTGRHHAQRCHDRPPVIADGGPHAAESQAALLVVDGVPLIPHTAQFGLERGAALDGATGQTRQTLAGQATPKFLRRKCGEQDLACRRRVSGHSTDSHVDTKGMGAFDQINAHRAETVQYAQVHGLPGLRPETLHDGLGHLA